MPAAARAAVRAVVSEAAVERVVVSAAAAKAAERAVVSAAAVEEERTGEEIGEGRSGGEWIGEGRRGRRAGGEQRGALELVRVWAGCIEVWWEGEPCRTGGPGVAACIEGWQERCETGGSGLAEVDGLAG